MHTTIDLMTKLDSLIAYLDHRYANMHRALVLEEIRATIAAMRFGQEHNLIQVLRRLIKLGDVDLLQETAERGGLAPVNAHTFPNLVAHINIIQVPPADRLRLIRLCAEPHGFDFTDINVNSHFVASLWTCADLDLYNVIHAWETAQEAHHFSYLLATQMFSTPNIHASTGIDPEHSKAFITRVVTGLASNPNGPRFAAQALRNANSQALALYLKAGGKVQPDSFDVPNNGNWMARLARSLSTAHGRLKVVASLPSIAEIPSRTAEDLAMILGGPTAKTAKTAEAARKKALKASVS